MAAAIEDFRARILAKRPLRIRGGGSKDFYGGVLAGEVLDTRAHAGIVNYEPTELVVTARAGTPLAELEAALAGQRQCLACEPPDHGGATVGGAVAAGLSGPRRATADSLRDFVLGVQLMDGEGRLLHFGGEVMKNVAGFDVSRLVAGSMGTLGLIVEVSLKVLPLPVADLSLRFECSQERALEDLNAWAGRPLPLAASAWQDGLLTVRLAGAEAAVAAARAALGGEDIGAAEATTFWSDLRHQRAAFFDAADGRTLWRVGLPSVAPPLALPGAPLVEWGGAQRWYRGGDAQEVRRVAAAAGGHATAYRGGDRAGGVFAPVPAPLLEVHTRLKQAFDPHGVFCPGRLYPEL